MKPVNEIVESIANAVRDPSYGRFTKGDIIEAVNEAKDIAVTDLIKTSENLLAFFSTADAPTDLNIVAGQEKIALPPNFARLIRAEILSGQYYYPIKEARKGEGYPGTSNRPLAITQDTGYYILGRYFVLDPPPLTALTAGLRLYYEHSIPDLLMGTVVAAGAQSVTLASAINRTLGQYPADRRDDIYNGLEIAITAGTGSGQQLRITDYAGSTRVATVVTPWSPAPDTTSSYAIVTPFPDTLAMLDKYLAARAPIVLLSTKRNEDVSGYIARANELQEAAMSALEPQTPGNRVMVPFDWENG